MAAQESKALLQAAEKVASKEVRSARKKTIKRNTGLRMKEQDNEYLKTLVNPEQFGGVRYPDGFSKLTATVQALHNTDLYVFPTESVAANQVEPAGTYLNVVSPTMLDYALQYKMSQPAPRSSLTCALTQTTDSIGLAPLNEDAASIQTSGDQLMIHEGQTLNVRAPWAWSDQDFTVPPMRGFDTNGDVFYGFPVAFDTAGGSFAFQVEFSSLRIPAGAPSTLVFVDAVSTKGTVRKFCTVTVATGATDLCYCLSTFTGAELGPIMNAGSTATKWHIGLPGIGFRIGFTDLGTVRTRRTYPITGLMAYYASNVIDLFPAPVPRFEAFKYPDETVYTSTVDQYRVVSMSVWMEYQGADLTNGGQAAAILYRGGRSAFENGLWDYDLVAETPGGYQGALKLGTYSFWLPNNERDMLFRGLDTQDRWKLPYIVNVGLVASPDIPHTLRLRVPCNFELISTSQFYQFAHALIRPDWILHAGAVTRTMATSMENPGHWDAIKSLLGKAVNTVGKVGNFVKDNWGWIAPAGAAVASLM